MLFFLLLVQLALGYAASLKKILVQLSPRDNVSSFLEAYPEFAPYVSHNFSFSTFQGFSGKFPLAQMRDLIHNVRVSVISNDEVVEATEVQNHAPRHLARINRREKLPSVMGQRDTMGFTYEYSVDGQENVDVYIIDSGIAVDHPEFEGRATIGVDLTGDDNPGDANGHGTHVAGIVGSRTFGVAKRANLISVKVLADDGSATLSTVIAGINYAVNRFEDNKAEKKAIANLSFGAGYNGVLNSAVDAAVAAGLPVVVAAGNTNRPACITSPASSPNVITVGAIDDETDTIASFSNWGPCVNVFASGVHVISTSNLNDGISIMSGTSMAAPAVSGLLAMFMGQGQTKEEAYNSLMELAVTGAIDGESLKVRPKSPDLLIHYDRNG